MFPNDMECIYISGLLSLSYDCRTILHYCIILHLLHDSMANEYVLENDQYSFLAHKHIADKV